MCYVASLPTPSSVRGSSNETSRPSLGAVVVVPWEISAEDGCTNGDVEAVGATLFGEGDDGSISDIVSVGGSWP
jgi:hypothetical protein